MHSIQLTYSLRALSPARMELSLYITLALVLATYIFTTHFLQRFKNLPPSPFPTLPLLGHLYLFKKPIHQTLSKISARHGPIVFLWFGSKPVLVVSSPSAAKECFTKNDLVFANRPQSLAAKHLGNNYKVLVFSSYGDNYRNLRRIAASDILSAKCLHRISEIRADEVKSLLRRLIIRSDRDNKVVNMRVLFFEMTLNIIMRIVVGKSFFGNKVTTGEETRHLKEIVEETFQLNGANLSDFLPFLRWFGSYEKKLIALQKKRDNFMYGLIDEIRKKKEESTDSNDFEGKGETMVDVLLSLQETDVENYTDEIIKGLMTTMLAAGSDTSVGTMEWTLSLLLNHPEALKKAQMEIDVKVGNDRLINESDMANLPYLHHVINEAMRMHLVAPLLIPHESSKECTVGGYRVPSGTLLMVNMWAIHRSPEIWDEPTKFKPERFETLNGTRDGFRFLPFGSGRRSCPGEGLALSNVGLALGSMIQCFDWERPSKDMIDMSEGSIGITMAKAQPLVAICTPRPIMANLLSQI